VTYISFYKREIYVNHVTGSESDFSDVNNPKANAASFDGQSLTSVGVRFALA
jgi:hypothetical protein